MKCKLGYYVRTTSGRCGIVYGITTVHGITEYDILVDYGGAVRAPGSEICEVIAKKPFDNSNPHVAAYFDLE